TLHLLPLLPHFLSARLLGLFGLFGLFARRLGSPFDFGALAPRLLDLPCFFRTSLFRLLFLTRLNFLTTNLRLALGLLLLLNPTRLGGGLSSGGIIHAPAPCIVRWLLIGPRWPRFA